MYVLSVSSQRHSVLIPSDVCAAIDFFCSPFTHFIHAKEKLTWTQDDGDNFYIDDVGVPLFIKDDGNVDWEAFEEDPEPLIHYDELYDVDGGKAVRRCYMFPYTNIVWCTQWRIGKHDHKTYEHATGKPWGAYIETSYGVTSSIPATQTEAPTSIITPPVELPVTGEWSTTNEAHATSDATPTTSEAVGDTSESEATTTTEVAHSTFTSAMRGGEKHASKPTGSATPVSSQGSSEKPKSAEEDTSLTSVFGFFLRLAMHNGH